MRTTVTDDIRKMVIGNYDNGLSAPQIREKLGLGTTTIYRILWAAGYEPEKNVRRREKRGNRCFTKEVEINVTEEYKLGGSLAELAVKHGCSIVTVRNIILRNNGTLREVGGPSKVFSIGQQLEIIKKYQEGMSQDKIALELCTSQTKISHILKNHKIDTGVRARGLTHGHWKGGRISIGKYCAVLVNDDNSFSSMRLSNGYVMEHRFVMAHYLNRPLTKYETVHHIDGNTKNNDIGNLQLRIGNHGKSQAYCCSDCGSKRIEPSELT